MTATLSAVLAVLAAATALRPRPRRTPSPATATKRGLPAPRRALGRRARRANRSAVERAYPDAIESIVLAVRAGYLPAAAIEAVLPHLAPSLRDAFAEVTDVVGVAELALMLEGIAADTYLDAQSMLEGSDARQLAGSIQVVDRQHIAILNYVLGEYPVPDTFQNTDQSVLSG